MVQTVLTQAWGLRYPIIGAPMMGAGGGALAGAVTEAGGLGFVPAGNATPLEFIERECAIARGADGSRRFGIGLMGWALDARPELLAAALAAKPYCVSVSFGLRAGHVAQVRAAGAKIATQVNTREDALRAEAFGVDLIVAQGTEAGGHTGHVASLPLLQTVLDAVALPVVAAGGIATARGLAAVLAAGAEGAWIGTALLASHESTFAPEAKLRVIAAGAADTVLTSAFDRAQRFAWPARWPGRALRNRFTDRWHEHLAELDGDAAAQADLKAAQAARDYEIANVYAGQAAGLVEGERPAGEIVRDLGAGAELLLRRRVAELL